MRRTGTSRWRRVRHWLAARFRASTARFVYAPEYDVDTPVAVIDPKRAGRILSFLDSQRLLRRGDLHRARAASLARLLAVHDEAYLDSLQDPEVLARVFGVPIREPGADELLTAHRVAVGGTALASELALADGAIAVNLSGGFHHAARDRGHGFCVFNDVALAVAEQRARGFDAPILVIDLDLHDGDGTRSIFARDDGVFTFSIHNQDLGPPEARASSSIALGGDVEDGAYLAALREHLPAVLDAVRPGLVFYLAGCDPAIDDVLGNWRVTPAGLLHRDRFVMESLRAYRENVATVVLLAGGYGGEAWRYSARFLATLLRSGRPIDPPPSAELVLSEYRALARLLREADLMTENDDDWSLSPADLPGASGAWGTPQHRLLGYYSRHGFELALERYGILPRLRAKGFEPLRLDFELDNPAGQTVRILTGTLPVHVLMELRVRRDATTVEGMELLAVEWLLLQNPLARFSRELGPLPGQTYPGLGLLKEVAALLVMACERLGLDGLVFTPAHYHLAVQSRRLLSFLDPTDEGRFRALGRALAGLPLADATRAVEDGRVLEGSARRRWRWRPSTMVLPVSRRLKARIASESYRRQAETAAATTEFALESPA
jgi:acetoin utilization deacetylase AcuC-like enzyme